MALSVYRRHGKRCRFYSKGQNFTACICPIWAYGYLNGRRVRVSVGLRDWSRAVRRVEKWEEKPEDISAPSASVPACIRAYITDCEARHLAPATIRSYRKVLDHLATFCANRGIVDIAAVDLETLTDYRNWRKVAKSTQGKERECLRAFCRFCVRRKWMAENWAADLDVPEDDSPPTLPFEPFEVEAILGAIDKMRNFYGASVQRAKLRARALVYLLLYSGLRISDAVKLKRSALDLKTGRLMLRQMKTRKAVYVRLHTDAIAALKALPVESAYFFWSGRGKLTSAVGSARRTIECLVRLAEIKGHPHRFRDTFAVELLKAGEDIRTVQLLLGHSSIRTTEKHYAPFVAAFQERLDKATAKLNFGSSANSKPEASRTRESAESRTDVSGGEGD